SDHQRRKVLEREHEQALPDDLARNCQSDNRRPSGLSRPDRLAQHQRNRKQHGRGGETGQEQDGPLPQPGPRGLRRQEIEDVEHAGEQTEQIAHERYRRDLEALPHEDRRAAERGCERENLPRAGHPAQRQQYPDQQDHAARVAEQRRVGEPRALDADVPARQIEGEEQSGCGDQQQEPPVDRARRASTPGKQRDDGQSDYHAPETGGNRAGVGHAHEPRAERERDVASDERSDVPATRVVGFLLNRFGCDRHDRALAPMAESDSKKDVSRMHENLFEPLTMGALQAKNRIFMAPLTRGRATLPGVVPNEMMATYYRQRAGAGLIISEATGRSEEHTS